MTQAETEAIAQGMLQITDEFQKQTGIADEVVDRIIEHSFRKMELVQARGMENMRAKEAGANV